MIGLYKCKPLKLCGILRAANSPQNKVAMRIYVTKKLFYILCGTPFLSKYFCIEFVSNYDR